LGRISKDDQILSLQVLKFVGCFFGLIFFAFNKVINYFFLKERIVFSFFNSAKIQASILRYLIKKYRIDLIHIHWGGFGFFPLAAIEHINSPTVITIHDFSFISGGCHIPLSCSHFINCKNCPVVKGKFLADRVSSNAELSRKILEKNTVAIVAPSNYAKDRVSEVVKNKRIHVIGNCYSDEYINQSNEKKEPNMPTLITVGIDTNNFDNKGHSTLIKVFKLLIREGVKFKYISVGKFYDFTEPHIREHYNSCNQFDLINLYKKSTLCLVPSKYETFSQVTMESILCRTPVVAYDLTGPRDIISNLENGLLISSFNEEEYAGAVCEFLKGNIEIRFNNDNVKKKFHPSSIYKSYLNVYKSLGAL
jgi:glycosyltransferase involved in cell wall biosynthesis